jgi:hypothetical protein
MPVSGLPDVLTETLENEMKTLTRFRTIPAISLMVLGLVALAGCSGGGATMQEIDGVLHVMNPAEPLRPDLAVTVTEALTIGSDDMGDEYLFAGIAGMEVDDGGNIYVLVMQDDHVRVYDPHGIHSRTFSQKGQGPGELFFVQPPSAMSFGKDGNLWISNLARQRISLFAPSGEHVRDVTFSRIPPMMIQTTKDGFMGLHIDQRGTDEPAIVETTVSLRRFNADGDTIDTLFDETFVLDVRKMAFEGFQSKIPLYTQDDQGRIWQCRPRTDAYEVNVFSPTGLLERVVEKDFTPIAKSEEELEEERRMIRELIQAQTQGQDIPFEINFEPSPHKSATGMPYYDPRGYIWVQVQREESLWANAFDLFDLEGRWLTRFVLDATLAPADLRFQGDTVYVVEQNPDDIPKIVIYTITIGD